MSISHHTLAQCACGSVVIGVAGEPILCAACYCDDCQEWARQLGALTGTGTPSVTGADGGTDFLLFRKDRIHLSKGSNLLHDYRLKVGSPTRRVVATCCNSAMFVDFEHGHWFSIYRNRFGDDAPPVQMRIQTRYRSGTRSITSDIPEYKSYPLKFFSKLLAARLGMLFGR